LGFTVIDCFWQYEILFGAENFRLMSNLKQCFIDKLVIIELASGLVYKREKKSAKLLRWLPGLALYK
jgi:hypothetical protein